MDSTTAQRMATEKQLSLKTLSLSGVYGSGTWFKESVYDYIKKGMGMVVGDGQNVWSFVHVDDVAEAYRTSPSQRFAANFA